MGAFQTIHSLSHTGESTFEEEVTVGADILLSAVASFFDNNSSTIHTQTRLA
ncbi:hypothetical protein BLGI_5073 [Brevibacillus laterosporus GI-9]|nr:hypothetical protein BLGI_5073 [Brevibacillus laterosporus GI-9]